jgi:hypothetical protein
MTTDPSWLYSTIAQCSAAIVAIVGGFITHSVLTLAAEKRSLIKQHSDAKRRLESLKKHGVVVMIPNIADLEENVLSLEARIKAFTYPPNLVWGLVILSYLSVVGILLPVLIIANEKFFDILRQFTAYLFAIGIIGLFTYISFQIFELRRKNAQS